MGTCETCGRKTVYSGNVRRCMKCYVENYRGKSVDDVPIQHMPRQERMDVCTILKKHHEELKEDNQRLTTEFLLEMME